jgi:hypothetical protein
MNKTSHLEGEFRGSCEGELRRKAVELLKADFLKLEAFIHVAKELKPRSWTFTKLQQAFPCSFSSCGRINLPSLAAKSQVSKSRRRRMDWLSVNCSMR